MAIAVDRWQWVAHVAHEYIVLNSEITTTMCSLIVIIRDLKMEALVFRGCAPSKAGTQQVAANQPTYLSYLSLVIQTLSTSYNSQSDPHGNSTKSDGMIPC
jgi:hypothetical protein